MLVERWFPVEGKTYVVLGLGRSGFSTIRWLLARGACVIAIDDNTNLLIEAQKLGAQIACQIPWNQISAVVQSPGVPLWFPQPHPITQEARDHKIPIIGEGDLLRATYPEAQFVGITGTNGKSTTTALVGHILKECGRDYQIGGNIGIPMLDLLPASIYVLELSSYQLDLSPHLTLQIAAWLNVSPDHLDRHNSFENYLMAKKNIFQAGTQTAVIAIDDEISREVKDEIAQYQKTIPVSISHSLKKGISLQGSWLQEDGEPVLNVNALTRLRGDHNLQNVAVAYGVCKALGLKQSEISEAIVTFPGLAHRQEWIATQQGVHFINDSKGTNAQATAKALAAFDQIYWIVGGKAKSEGITPLFPYFPKIIHAFLIGESQEVFAKVLEGKVPYTKSGTLEKALEASYKLALADGLKNPNILLSPACASFDQFRDFEHRGEVFRCCVQAIKNQG